MLHPLLAVAAFLNQTPALPFALKSGDRVVFYGDSITDYGAYPLLIDTFVATRYPDLNVSFENAGVGGERVGGGGLGPVDVRLTRDVFARRPTVVTCMLGMNDGEYRAYDPALFDRFREGYEHLADRIQKEAPDSRGWLFRPSAYDDVTRPPAFNGGYNGVLLRYGDFVAELARRRGFGIVDLNSTLRETLSRAKDENAEWASKLVGDRIHPIPEAHLALAASILRAWNASPIVSSVKIDWDSGKSRSMNAVLSDWKAGSFRLRERSLPMPIDRSNLFTALVARASDFDASLNREDLSITGAPAGKYELEIDDRKVGTFGNEELAKGVNLALFDTPMVTQAKVVANLTSRIVGLRYTRWRSVELPLANAPAKERDAVVESMRRLERALVRQRREAAKPRPHLFSLRKIG